MTDNYQTAIGRIMDCILRDVALWEREYCETPERIFVSPRLHAMMKYDYSMLTLWSEGLLLRISTTNPGNGNLTGTMRKIALLWSGTWVLPVTMMASTQMHVQDARQEIIAITTLIWIRRKRNER